MTNKQKASIATAIVGVLVIVGIYYMFSTQQLEPLPGTPQQETSEAAQVFEQEMIDRSYEKDVRPIEGFDAQILLGVYQGLSPQDFDGVQTFEGVYVSNGGEVTFQRTQDQPISTAERTVSNEGYATLMNNLAQRLNLPAQTPEDGVALVEAVDLSVSSYEECIEAGFPSLESYPEQCLTPNGSHFVRRLSDEQLQELSSEVTMRGTYICLPRWVVSGPLQECVSGLFTDDESYLALRETRAELSGIENGMRIQVKGTLTPGSIEDYRSVGVIEVDEVTEL